MCSLQCQFNANFGATMQNAIDSLITVRTNDHSPARQTVARLLFQLPQIIFYRVTLYCALLLSVLHAIAKVCIRCSNIRTHLTNNGNHNKNHCHAMDFNTQTHKHTKTTKQITHYNNKRRHRTNRNRNHQNDHAYENILQMLCISDVNRRFFSR